MKVTALIVSSLAIPATAITLFAYDFSGKKHQGSASQQMGSSEGFKGDHLSSAAYVINLTGGKSFSSKGGATPESTPFTSSRSGKASSQNPKKKPFAAPSSRSGALYDVKTTPTVSTAAQKMPSLQTPQQSQPFVDSRSMPPLLEKKDSPKNTPSRKNNEENNNPDVRNDLPAQANPADGDADPAGVEVLNEVAEALDDANANPLVPNKKGLCNLNMEDADDKVVREEMADDEAINIADHVDNGYDAYQDPEEDEENVNDNGAQEPAGAKDMQRRAGGKYADRPRFLEPLDVIMNDSIERFQRAFEQTVAQKSITAEKAIRYIGKAKGKNLEDGDADKLLRLVINTYDGLSIHTLIDLIEAQTLRNSEKRELLVETLLKKKKSIADVTEAIFQFSKRNRATQRKLFGEYIEAAKEAAKKDLEKDYYPENIQLFYNIMERKNAYLKDAFGNIIGFKSDRAFNTFAARFFAHLEDDANAHNFIQEHVLKHALKQNTQKAGETLGAFFAEVCILEKEVQEKERTFVQGEFYEENSAMAKEYILSDVNKQSITRKGNLPPFKQGFLERLWSDSTQDRYATTKCFPDKNKDDFQGDFLKGM